MKSIKTLGIATAMALALIAFAGAGAASASKFINTGGGTTNLSGSIYGAKHELKLGGEGFLCKNVAFSGQVVGEEPVEIVASPELSACEWQPPNLYNWKMNGCKFRFNPGFGTSGTGESIGSMDIVGCEKPMSIASSPSCEVTIGNQKYLGTVKYRNINAEKEILIGAKLTGITYTRTTGCPSAAGTYSNGTYTGEWVMKGSFVGGGQRPIRVEASSEPSTHKAFSTEEAPVTITGANPSPNALMNIGGNGSVNCGEHKLSGAAATVTPTSVTVTSTYGNCEFLGRPTTVSMGGCSYVLRASGGFEIAGATCASNPITLTTTPTMSGSICKATFGPQSGTSGLTYENVGSGKSHGVITGGVSGGLTTTVTGAFCANQGTFSTSTYKDIETLTAFNSGGKQQGFAVE